MWSLAEIQLLPSAALTWTVTLSCGAAAMALSDGSGFGSLGLSVFGVGVGLSAGGVGALGDLRLAAVVLALERGEPDEPDHGDDRGDHGRGPVGPAPLGADALRLEQGGGGGRRRPPAVLVVVLGEERGGIEVDGLGEGPDVAAGVHVATAAAKSSCLDGMHDGDAHPGGVLTSSTVSPASIRACWRARPIEGRASSDTSSNGRSSSGELPMDTGAPFERLSHRAGGSV